MAVDPALAGLLGALVGGAATFAGTVVSNTQQARHARDQRRHDRKVEAYSNTMRFLLRAAHRSAELGLTDEPPPSGDSPQSSDGINRAVTWFEDLIDAEYWMTVLTTACGTRHRTRIQEAARTLFDEIDRFIGTIQRITWKPTAMMERPEVYTGDLPIESLVRAYQIVAEAARDDIGFED
jgi:hypothetical protein